MNMDNDIFNLYEKKSSQISASHQWSQQFEAMKWVVEIPFIHFKPEWEVKEVCKPGSFDCCRYLGADQNGFTCLKLTGFKELIDKRVVEKTFNAIGDNCEGIKEVLE